MNSTVGLCSGSVGLTVICGNGVEKIELKTDSSIISEEFNIGDIEEMGSIGDSVDIKGENSIEKLVSKNEESIVKNVVDSTSREDQTSRLAVVVGSGHSS